MKKTYLDIKRISVSYYYKQNKYGKKTKVRNIGVMCVTDLAKEGDVFYVSGDWDIINLDREDEGRGIERVVRSVNGNRSGKVTRVQILSIGSFVEASTDYKVYKTNKGYRLERIEESARKRGERLFYISEKRYDRHIFKYIAINNHYLNQLGEGEYVKVTEDFNNGYKMTLEAVPEFKERSFEDNVLIRYLKRSTMRNITASKEMFSIGGFKVGDLFDPTVTDNKIIVTQHTSTKTA